MQLDAQALFRNAPAAICILRGPEHVFDTVNEDYQRLFPGRLLLGRTVREALPELKDQGFFELLDRVYQTGEPYLGTEILVRVDKHGDGTLASAWFNFVYQPIPGGSGIEGIFVHGYDVTGLVEARRRAEQLAQSLRERDELLSASQEISPIGFAYFRILRDAAAKAADFEYLFQNEAASRLNRLGAGTSCAGRRILEVFPSIAKTPLFAHYRAVADTGQEWQGEERYTGEHLDNWFRITCVRPTVDTLTLTVEDVTTQRKLADRLGRLNALTAALSAARSIVEVAEVAVGAAAEAGASTAALLRPVDANIYTVIASRGISLEGRPDLRNLSFAMPTPSNDAMTSRQPGYVETAAEFERRYPELNRLTGAVNSASAALPLIAAGQLVGALVFRFKAEHRFDAGEREFLEALASLVSQAFDRAALFDKANLARAELERQKKRLDVMLEEMPVGVLVVERGGRLILQNRTASEIWGRREPLESSSARYAQYQAFHADGRPMTKEDWPSTQILSGVPCQPREVRIVRDDGSTGWMTLTGAPLLDERGEVEAALVVMSDVTRIKEAEARASKAGAEAQSANRAKDEFLAMLGHELRNPLAPMVTALSLMRLRGGNALERERAVIERQVQHLTRLVDDLLDVSRITRGKVELRTERLLIGDVVARAIEASSPLLEKRGHHLEVRIAEEPLAVRGDPVRLAQVVSNLITNAAKYTEPGGHLRVSAAREGGQVVVRVADDGIGIAEDMLPRVFDLFMQEQQGLDRSEGGLGLGLAIVRSLVSAHGGTVAAYSEGRRRGSEFVVRLPELEDDAAAARSGPGASRELPVLRVLVVDDNSDAAELIAEAIGAMGCQTRLAHDGPTALRLVAEGFVPDVALLDLGLPVMDGFELATRLLQIPALHDLRLVAITGYGQAADRERTAGAGFYAHLVKPVTIEQLGGLLLGMAAQR